ncbi:hypothetical protein [Ramlibacter sp.]|uniref:hypothetical protein n=1 Tax=Ramlibacter sp. TaxID=1917967 RepID=UPI003D099BBC
MPEEHFTIREAREGQWIVLELWGGLDLRNPRVGLATGDLIDIYDDDERDEARIHCKALNHDLSTDLWAWVRELPAGAGLPETGECCSEMPCMVNRTAKRRAKTAQAAIAGASVPGGEGAS